LFVSFIYILEKEKLFCDQEKESRKATRMAIFFCKILHVEAVETVYDTDGKEE